MILPFHSVDCGRSATPYCSCPPARAVVGAVEGAVVGSAVGSAVESGDLEMA